jgi:small subunit ribosomal protein S27Ae
MKKIEFFKIEGDKISRIRKHCPKCGPAVFLAEHKNRFSCGKCGYTEFKGGVRKEPPIQKINEKTIDQTTKEKPGIEQEKTPAEDSKQQVDVMTKDNQNFEKPSEKKEDFKSDDENSKEE